MLLPDNIQPELCLYYNGAIVIQELQNGSTKIMVDLYLSIKEKYDISFSIFILTLDWLYLACIVETNMKGEIELCSLKH